MSVKGKVKKLNKKIENLQEELQTYQLSNSRLRNKNDMLNIELEGQKAVIEELENSIPVSLVEEKLEESNRKIKYEDNEKVIIYLHKQRKILQELLEKRK